MIQVPKLTIEDARIILAGSRQKAEEIGVAMDIAVVDEGGHLLTFERMDGAKITSIQVAMDKAFTAACTRKGTHEYTQVAGAGGPAFGIFVSNQGRFTIYGGGLPILVDGICVGAVGCSSGSVAQDMAVAEAGIDSLLRQA
jgi:uncharacterized protein GlcG (DUF336 family)